MLILHSIVFIHGIFGNRRSTWEKDGIFWPEQLLPNDIPDARIITYGYCTTAIQLSQSHKGHGGMLGLISQNGLKENAELLSAELVSQRLGEMVITYKSYSKHNTADTGDRVNVPYCSLLIAWVVLSSHK